jgi:hypothetical protein
LTGKIRKTKHFNSVNRYIDLFIPLVGHKVLPFSMPSAESTPYIGRVKPRGKGDLARQLVGI